MSPLVIIQARTGSSRLPGKVLLPINGKKIIHHVIDACKDFETIVAIPYHDEKLKRAIGDRAEVLEGPEFNVAQRFDLALAKYPTDWFIRVCADSPALTPDIVARPTRTYYEDFDVVRTVGPPGLNVELVNAATFRAHWPWFNTEQREHVTQAFYEYERFKVKDIRVEGEPCVVDTQADYDRVKEIMECGP